VGKAAAQNPLAPGEQVIDRVVAPECRGIRLVRGDRKGSIQPGSGDAHVAVSPRKARGVIQIPPQVRDAHLGLDEQHPPRLVDRSGPERVARGVDVNAHGVDTPARDRGVNLAGDERAAAFTGQPGQRQIDEVFVRRARHAAL
jgi:hypothetical protein